MNTSRLHTRGRKVRHMTIDIQSGHEGPHHDPYSVETIKVQLNDKHFILRLGSLSGIRLAVWRDSVRKPLFQRDACGDKDEQRLVRKFEKLAGVTIDQCQMVFNRNYQPDPMGKLSDYE